MTDNNVEFIIPGVDDMIPGVVTPWMPLSPSLVPISIGVKMLVREDKQKS